jgi:predicted dehydrogenase
LEKSLVTMRGVPFERRDTVRVGFAGVGGRGRSLLRDVLAVEGAQIMAVYDRSEESVTRALARIEEAGQPAPAAVYSGDESGFEELCRRDDVDLVYIATPWDLHVPMAVHAMEQGKHAAVEVPAATTLEGCWQLVDTSERTRRHCVMLENCCYGYNELLVLGMVRDGLFGQITHGEVAYIHDLRSILLADKGEGLWRRDPHAHKDGNLYPTHGLGPVARCMDIHQGDRFTLLVSMSSREASLTEYRDRTTAEDDPKRRERYVCGDMNTSLIKTEQGRTIVLQHDVVTPRAYDRINLIAGTKGTFRDVPPRLFLDDEQGAGGGEGEHGWGTIDAYKERYEHLLWTRVGELARKLGGHGGMDFLMNYRLIECFRQGLPPDIDVYDAAAWSAPGPLSEMSVAQGSMPVAFPDFTRGNWQA